MAAGSVRDVVAKLVFLLIAGDGKRGDDGSELVVAKSFETGCGVKICAERKSESQAEIGVAILDMVKIAGFQCEPAGPGRGKAKLLAEEEVVVIRSGGRAGGRKSGLLDEIVLG